MSVPVQGVDATPSSLLIRQYFCLENRSVRVCSIKTLARMVFPLNQGSQTIVGLLRPLQVDFDLVLRRPIESTALIGQVESSQNHMSGYAT